MFFVYGPSGFGKSHAIQKLPVEETLVICSDRKPLPWFGAHKDWKTVYKPGSTETTKFPDLDKSSFVRTVRFEAVMAAIKHFKESKIKKYFVLDTMTHIIVADYMARAKERGYDKWTDLAKGIYDIIAACMEIEDENKSVIIVGHDETSTDAAGSKMQKVRTMGKLLDEKVDIPSLFTVVLIPYVERDGEDAEYGFLTQSDGTNYAKSPPKMFAYKEPNDYLYLLNKMKAYYKGEQVQSEEE